MQFYGLSFYFLFCVFSLPFITPIGPQLYGDATAAYQVLKQVTRTKLIRYIPKEHIIHETEFFKVNDYYGAQVRQNGRWSNIEDYPKNPVVLPAYFINFTCTMAYLKNVYINWASGILTNDYWIVPDENDWFLNARRPSSGVVVAQYDYAIAVGRESNRYGHWILDYMCPLLLIPFDIIKTYKILNVPDIPIAHEMLDWLEVPKENRIIRKPSNQLIFCEHVYFPYKPLVEANYLGYPVQLIRELVFKHLKLNGIPQTKYVFLQRKARRVVLNMDEIVALAKTTFPEYPWEYIPDSQSLAECGKTWAAIKLIISGNGSHMFRCVCMQKGCVAIEFLGPAHDWSCMGAILSMGVHVLSIKTAAISDGMWYGGGNYRMEVDKVINSIKYVKPYLDGQPFPKGPLVI